MAGSKYFYDTVRAELFGGAMTGKQVEGMEVILTAWSDTGIKEIRYVAYSLATTFHETAKTMQPIAEYGKGAGRDYGKKLKMSRKPYTTPNRIYYGRGYVQLTWFENYEAMSKILGIDLLNNPDLAMQPNIAADIMIKGMLNGHFTGKRLGEYFYAGISDAFNARKIINGLDKAGLIQGYYNVFYKALLKV